MKPIIPDLKTKNHVGHLYASEDIIAVGRAANYADGFKYLQEIDRNGNASENGMLLPKTSTLEIRNDVFFKPDRSPIVDADYKLGAKNEIIFEMGDVANFTNADITSVMFANSF